MNIDLDIQFCRSLQKGNDYDEVYNNFEKLYNENYNIHNNPDFIIKIIFTWLDFDSSKGFINKLLNNYENYDAVSNKLSTSIIKSLGQINKDLLSYFLISISSSLGINKFNENKIKEILDFLYDNKYHNEFMYFLTEVLIKHSTFDVSDSLDKIYKNKDYDIINYLKCLRDIHIPLIKMLNYNLIEYFNDVDINSIDLKIIEQNFIDGARCIDVVHYILKNDNYVHIFELENFLRHFLKYDYSKFATSTYIKNWMSMSCLDKIIDIIDNINIDIKDTFLYKNRITIVSKSIDKNVAVPSIFLNCKFEYENLNWELYEDLNINDIPKFLLPYWKNFWIQKIKNDFPKDRIIYFYEDIFENENIKEIYYNIQHSIDYDLGSENYQNAKNSFYDKI